MTALGNSSSAAAGETLRPSDRAGLYTLLVTAVRLVLGLEFVVNGLNWWVKLIDPYPSIADFIHHAPPDDVVGAMIRSGVLFHVVKAVELVAGVALLTNCFVPLALVAALPVTVNVFMVDVLISTHLRAHIMGTGAMMMSGFLMLAYLPYYRPMLDLRTQFETPATASSSAPGRQFAWLSPQACPAGRRLMVLFGGASLAIGLVMIVWVFVMIGQHFLRI